MFRVRAAAVELARSGPSRRRGGRAGTSLGERLQQHRLEQAAVPKCLDQSMAASLMLDDLDAGAIGNAVRVN